jgi:hypothetical protein
VSEIHVAAGGDLQGAINRALPGDEIVLPAGARYVGQFTLPPKDGTVVVRSAGVLPDRRVGPQDAHLFASIWSGVSAMALIGHGARNWFLDGLRLEPNVGGEGAVAEFIRASHIRLFRILLDVPEGQQQKRGLLMNGDRMSVQGCHIAGVWKHGQQSQAICAWEGDGLDILDNFASAASQNVLIGGDDPTSEAAMSRNVRVEGNDFTKPASWRVPSPWLRNVANLFELKGVIGATVRNNRMSGNWADAQAGRAIVFTPRNQEGRAPFSTVRDVLFAGNTITDTDEGFNITGYDDENPTALAASNIEIRDNVLECRGRGVLLHKELGDVRIYRNRLTVGADAAVLSLDTADMWKAGEAKRVARYAAEHLVWAENVTNGYIHSTADANGEAGIKARTVSYSLTVPTDAPLPSIPEPVDGAPVPLPGTSVDAPSMPEPSALELDMRAVKAELAELIAAHAKLLAYLKAAPKVTRIEQLRAYFKAAPGV